MEHKMKYATRTITTAQLDYINKMLGQCIREELDLDAQEIYYRGRMQGIDDLDRRLDNVFSNVQDQLEAGECNLTT